MKSRGVRFTESQWRKIKKEAKEKKVNPSDVLRDIVDAHYSK